MRHLTLIFISKYEKFRTHQHNYWTLSVCQGFCFKTLHHPFSFSVLPSVTLHMQVHEMTICDVCSPLRTWRQPTTTRLRLPMTPCWCLIMKGVALTQAASPLWTRQAAEIRTMTASASGGRVSKNWPTCTEAEMTCCSCSVAKPGRRGCTPCCVTVGFMDRWKNESQGNRKRCTGHPDVSGTH